jgi:hypothetical protein
MNQTRLSKRPPVLGNGHKARRLFGVLNRDAIRFAVTAEVENAQTVKA